MFQLGFFIEASFRPQAIDNRVLVRKADFKNVFNLIKPWIPQLADFIESNGGNPGSINKIEIAKNLVALSSPTPKTFAELADLINKIRIINPIKHPDDVEVKI